VLLDVALVRRANVAILQPNVARMRMTAAAAEDESRASAVWTTEEVL